MIKKRIHITQTDEKHQEWLEYYHEVVRSYGEHAKFMTQTKFYQDVADKFHVSPAYAGRVINNMQKNGHQRHPQGG